MLAIDRIDTDDRGQVRRFIDLPFGLNRHCPQWVPPLQADVALALNRAKHLFLGGEPYKNHRVYGKTL